MQLNYMLNKMPSTSIRMATRQVGDALVFLKQKHAHTHTQSDADGCYATNI